MIFEITPEQLYTTLKETSVCSFMIIFKLLIGMEENFNKIGLEVG